MVYGEELQEIEDNLEKIMLLKDFICIFTFFGNDFLPKILSLSAVYDNMDTLIGIYKKVMHKKFGEMVIIKENRHEINFDHFKSFLEQLAIEEPKFYQKYIDAKKHEEYDRFQISYYDCAKYVISSEYYFCHFIEYFNKKVLPEYHLLSQFKKDESPVKKILESFNIQNSGKLQVNYETQFYFSNFIEQNKNNFSMKSIGIIKFVDNDYKLKLFDFELMAFRNKKSAWKLLLNEFGYANDEKIPTRYDHADAQNYLDGFSWVLDWYFDRMMHPTSLTKISIWFYPNHKSPFIAHILDYIKDKKLTNINSDLLLVPRAEFLTKDEHKFYTEPSAEEKRKIGNYIDRTIRTLYNSGINYVTDKIFEVENKLKRNRWDGKIVLDCHHAKYFEKCYTDYKIYSFKDFVQKFRGVIKKSKDSGEIKQEGGRSGLYKCKYRKYTNKILAMIVKK
jgi:hypothetical protein